MALIKYAGACVPHRTGKVRNCAFRRHTTFYLHAYMYTGIMFFPNGTQASPPPLELITTSRPVTSPLET